MSPYCTCSTVPGMVYACSGPSDLGELADRAARQLRHRRTALMGSLASVAAGQSGALSTAEAATKVLVVDGCDRDCARLCLERRGFTDVLHLRVLDVVGEELETACEAWAIEHTVEAARSLLLPAAPSGLRRVGPRRQNG